MELKDVILSTIAELGEEVEKIHEEEKREAAHHSSGTKEVHSQEETPQDSSYSDDELKFLQSMRERLLVLFEGFQSPNNRSVEAKIDLTLNFLEYLLAMIEERMKKLEKS